MSRDRIGTRNAVETAIDLSKTDDAAWDDKSRLPSTPKPLRCAFCREGKVSCAGTKDHLVWLSKNSVIIIRSVPFTSCGFCGREYQSPETRKAIREQIEAIKKNRSLARPIAAYQADFQ